MIDLKDIYKDIEDICKEEMQEIVDEWFEFLQKRTPEDRGVLQKDNIKWDIVEYRGDLKARLSNESEYAEYVEFSITPKNYYKDWWRRKGASPFYQWKGAGMFQKTADFIENKK